MRAKIVNQSSDIFWYAVPARTVTKKALNITLHCLLPSAILCKFQSSLVDAISNCRNQIKVRLPGGRFQDDGGFCNTVVSVLYCNSELWLL